MTRDTYDDGSDDIPTEVLDALEDVRASGEINMFARRTVINLAFDLCHDIDWLEENKDRYMEALIAMAKRRVL